MTMHLRAIVIVFIAVFITSIYYGWIMQGEIASVLFVLFCMAGGGFALGVGARMTYLYIFGE